MKEKEKIREELLKRKHILEAQRNSIARYMGPFEHDESLRREWELINKELQEIENRLNEFEAV